MENAMTDMSAHDERLSSLDNDHINKTSSGFNVQRADSYALASQTVPEARAEEHKAVKAALNHLGVTNCQKIVELGAGQGFGTTVLLDCLAPGGTVIGVDASSHMTQQISPHPNIKLHIGALDQLTLDTESIDFAFSLAAFHHIPNKFLVTQELFRILRPGSYFLIVDVDHGTPAQEFFDYVIREHCSSGHDADFLDVSWAKEIANRTCMEHLSSIVKDTDWKFESEESMLRYICNIFCLELDQQEVKPLVDKWLKPHVGEDGKTWILPWSLGFHTLKKPLN